MSEPAERLAELADLTLRIRNECDGASSSGIVPKAPSESGQCIIVRITDGRACRLCGRKDWDSDPVGLKIKNVEVVMYWGKPCGKDGKSTGNHCGYCIKYFLSQIKSLRSVLVTLQMSEQFLAANKNSLELHKATIDQIIDDIIEKGGGVRTHVCWTKVNREVLIKEKRNQLIIARPGYKFLPAWFYEKHYGKLEENGMAAAEGHKAHALDAHDPAIAQEGVLIPDDPITKIKFEEVHASVHQTEMYGGPDLEIHQKTLAESFSVHVGLLTQETATKKALQAIDTKRRGPAGAIQDAPKAAGQSKANARPASLQGFAAKRGLAADPAESPPAKQRRVAESSPLGSTPAEEKGSREIEEGQAPAEEKPSTKKRKSEGGGDQSKKQGINNKKGPGRPPTNYIAKADGTVNEFTASESTDPLWWGPEAKTKIKDLKKLHTEINGKAEAATTTLETDSLNMQYKRLGIVMSLVEGVNTHGFDAQAFHDIFDNQNQLAELAGVSIEPPKFLLWHRSKGDIKSTDAHHQWVKRTTSLALETSGVSNVEVEQQRLYSEKLASVLRMKDQKSRTEELKLLCDANLVSDVDSPVANFIETISVCLTADEINDLDLRHDLLSEAVVTLKTMLPD